MTNESNAAIMTWKSENKIKVCDAIMGQGKTQSVIAHMNSHPEKRWIYITPFLDESKRICAGCENLRFAEPNNFHDKVHHSKVDHTAELVREGRNIATTHQAFKNYTPEMLDDIRERGYVLVIDENVDIFERVDIHPDDIDMMVTSGYVKESGGLYRWSSDKQYCGSVMHSVYRTMKSRDLIRMNDNGDSFFFWALPPELLGAFDEVFILTYMFKGQSLYYFMDLYNIKYDMISVSKNSDGEYRFCDYPGEMPEYVYHLNDMINVYSGDNLNNIGKNHFALSMNWFENDTNGHVNKLKNNIYNYFMNISGSKVGERLWATYKKDMDKIKGKGYTKSYLSFNCRATNAYKDRDVLVYAVNPFMNVGEKTFYQKNGIVVDEDAYSLSIMIQWIWRSAIRDGKKINIYIPSKRMRNLFFGWMNSFNTKGGENDR